MQKLLRAGNPYYYYSPNLLTPFLIPQTLFLGFNKQHQHIPMPSAAGMATAAVTCRNPRFSFANNGNCSSSNKLNTTCNPSYRYRCRNCRCAIQCGNTSNGRGGVRAWNGAGKSVAWFHSSGLENMSVSDVTVSAVSSGNSGGENGDSESGDSGENEKSVKYSRRKRGGLSGGGNGQVLVPANLDLLTIPGVGQSNLKKLVKNGIGGVAELKKIYKDKFHGKSNQNMVEFLRSSVGIKHRNHAESITTFIKESVDEELKDDRVDNVMPQKKRLTFCVEGNISVGKTTFLQRIANETLELQDLVEIVPEPINRWQDIGPDHFNILDAFYADPERYAYTFQNYVFVTRVMQEKESAGGIKPLRLMERSVFSDRMVFVRAVHEAKWMSEMEISIYDSWFDPVVSTLPGLIPDAFIYLRASPDTCHKRMMMRKRTEEGGVSLDYLRGLHEKHESWLFPFESGNHGVLSVSNPPVHMDSSLHPDIKDRVFYLEGNHMHPSIQKVPALVLDCEPTIDFSKDIEAKKQYARQVAEFFQYVKKVKEVPEAGRVGHSQVMLPHGGLWVPPQGKQLSESLKSLDFRHAMSFMPGSGSG